MYRVVNQPEYIAMEDYQREEAKYVNDLKDVPGIVSINNFGNVGAPGLSDLDFLVVVEDDFDSKHSIKLSCRPGLSILDGRLSLRNFSKNPNRYDPRILLHGPAVVTRSQLQDLNYIIYAPHLQTLHGEPVTPDMFLPSDEILGHLRLMYLIDFSFARMTHFALSNASEVLDKRGWLTRTWSLTHSAKMFQEIGLELSPEATETVLQLRQIREQWNRDQTCDDQLFIESYGSSEQLLLEIFGKAIAAEKKKLGADAADVPDSSTIMGDKRVNFRQSCLTPSAIAKRSVYRFRGRQKWYFECDLPSQYALHLKAYGRKRVNASLPESTEGSSYLNSLQKRARIAREHRRFLYDGCMTFAMGAYLGFPLPPSNPIIRSIDWLYWKAFSR